MAVQLAPVRSRLLRRTLGVVFLLAVVTSVAAAQQLLEPAVEGAPAVAAAADAFDAAALAAEVARLERQVVGLLAELAVVRRDRDRLERLLRRVVEQETQFEADRRLLIELRKDFPATRVEAEAYLRQLQRLALLADPVRLASPANRLMEASPSYLVWRESEFGDAEARARAFAETGAHGFPTALTTFRNAVLLTVSNRIEGLLVLVE